MLLTVDFYENFIDVERIAETSVFSFQSAGINGSELDTPEADGLSTDCDTSFSEQIFDIAIAVAEIEAIVPSDCIADDVGRESMTLVSIHEAILPKSAT